MLPTSSSRAVAHLSRAVSSALAAAAAVVLVAVGAAASAPAASAAVPVSVSAAQAGAPEIAWGVVPADAAGPDGRVSLRHVLDPGASAADAIAVTNHSREPAVFTVSAGDGVVGADGAYDVRTESPAAGGAWLHVGGLDAGSLALAAGETRVLPVTIDVPADATPGDHPAGVVVGLSSDEAGVTLTHRVGVRVHLQVAGEVAAALRIDDATASFAPSWVPFAPGTLTVEYRVSNTGNVRLGASATAEASGPLGMLPAAGARDAVELLPGGSAAQRVEIPLMPLLFTAGELSVSPVALGEDRVALPDAATSGFSAVAVPWATVGAIVIGGGAVALVVVIVVRGRERTRRRIDAAIAADRAAR